MNTEHESGHTPPDPQEDDDLLNALSRLDDADDAIDVDPDETHAADDSNGKLEKGHAPRGPRNVGRNPSKHRRKLREFAWLERLRRANLLLPDDKQRSDDRLTEVARKLTDEETKATPEVARELDNWRQSSTSPDYHVDKRYLLAAIMRIPQVAWLVRMIEDLSCPSGQTGPQAQRRLPVAVLMVLAMGLTQCRIKDAIAECLTNPRTAWAVRYPVRGKALGRSALYDALRKISQTPGILTAIEAVNVELFRQIAELTDDDGKLLHPNMGVVGHVDGSDVEFHHLQIDSEEGEERAVLKGVSDRARPIRYEGGKFWFGGKLTALTDGASGLTPIPELIQPHGECEAVIGLLDRLLLHWPECPLLYLVGDALYGHPKELAKELETRYGVHPVFPWRKVGKHVPHSETKGVPHCKHGEMKRRGGGDINDATERLKPGGTPRGQVDPKQSWRIRWECAVKGSKCKPVTTRPDDVGDYRAYPFLPHQGDSPLVARRVAFGRLHNVVEGVFSRMRRNGLLGRGAQRLASKNEQLLELIIALAILMQTAGRYAHETGRYSLAAEEGSLLTFDEDITEQNPQSGPTAELLDDVTKKHADRWGEPKPPRNWPLSE